MAQMTFSSQKAQSVVKELQNEAKQVNTIKTDLSKNINEVTGYWKGDSQSAFLAQYKKFSPSLDQLQELVTSISKQLTEIAQYKESVEKKIASAFK